jgi:carbon monoxide dehydrogenase subunit G
MGKIANTFEVVIDRPVQDVWDYVSDPSNLPEWLSGISDIRKSTDTMKVGESYGFKRRFLGRQMDGTSTVTVYEPTSKYAYHFTSGEVEATITYELEPLGSGTLLNFSMEATVGGFFGVAPKLVLGRATGEYERDLEKLKEVLNPPAYGHDPGFTPQSEAPQQGSGPVV